MGTEPAKDNGWAGRLNLRFVARGEETVLTEKRHVGPLLVQRPFYPEGRAVCHAYLVHPPGGLVQGDRLRLDVTVEAGAHALLTTPGATRFYRCDEGDARLTQHMHVADGAVMEWLPQETIAFDGTRARAETIVDLDPAGRFFGWELLCLGRPASDDWFERGLMVQRIEIRRGGRPLFWERGRFEGGGEVLRGKWGLAGYPVSATAVAAGLAPLDAGALRERIAAGPRDGIGALTAIDGMLVARCLARNGEEAREWLSELWAAVRPLVTGLPASPPRIWRT